MRARRAASLSLQTSLSSAPFGLFGGRLLCGLPLLCALTRRLARCAALRSVGRLLFLLVVIVVAVIGLVVVAISLSLLGLEFLQQFGATQVALRLPSGRPTNQELHFAILGLPRVQDLLHVVRSHRMTLSSRMRSL